jgi:murein L,D-transpeptidase YcbB/YkuD
MKEFPHLFTQKDWDLINEKLGKTNQTTTTTTTIPGKVLKPATYQFTNTLQIGMQSPGVIELQKRLKEEGVYNGPITGYFGPLTEAAVKSYQKKYGIKPTGIVGPITRDRLNSSQNQISSTITNIKNQSENQKTQCPYFTKSLRLGMNDNEVEKIQQFLINQGFLPQDFKKSSLFDKTTEDAVKKFQTKYHNEILKPWGLSSPTGYWYTATKKQANKLIGCE